MKYLFFIATSIGLIFTSACEVEPIDAALLDELDNNAPINGDNPNQSNDYFPRALGNTWNYQYNNSETATITIIGSQVINGIEYFEFNRFFTDDIFELEGMTSFIRREGDSYIYLYKMIDNPLIDDITIEYSMLKSNLAVGETWTDLNTITYEFLGFSFDIDINTTGKILQKNITVNVNNVTYNDVILVESVIDTNNDIVTSYYWFAKNVGIIKAIEATELNGNPTEQFLLQSFSLN